MPEWRGQSRGNKLGYAIFVFVCKYAGLRPAYFVLRFVAFYYFIFSRQSSRHIYQYFRQRQNYKKGKALRAVYTNYYKFGQCLLDKIVVMSGVRNPFTYHFDGEENLLAMVAKGQGGILLSAHIGNWEVAGHFLQRLNTKIHVVMFDNEHRQIKEYLEGVTGQRKFNVIAIKNDLSHVYEIGEALQKNELICMHADRFIGKEKTITKPILGDDALFPAGPFVLAATFNVPVSIVFAFKESSTHYHFFGSKPIIKSEAESKSEFKDRLANEFVSSMEERTRQYPEQWFNYYNFWNHA